MRLHWSFSHRVVTPINGRDSCFFHTFICKYHMAFEMSTVTFQVRISWHILGFFGSEKCLRITEWDLSSSSGKVPKLQQLLVQRGFLYGPTRVSIGALRVNSDSVSEHLFYLSKVRDTIFHVEDVKNPQRNI